MIIIHGVGVVASGGPNAWRNRGLGSPLALLGEGRDAVGDVQFLLDVAGEWLQWMADGAPLFCISYSVAATAEFLR